MAFCKRCFVEFKKQWHEQHPGEVFNINMKDVIYKCQVPMFSTDTYGETIVVLFDCTKKAWRTYSHKEWLKRQQCDGSRDCFDSCMACDK